MKPTPFNSKPNMAKTTQSEKKNWLGNTENLSKSRFLKSIPTESLSKYVV